MGEDEDGAVLLVRVRAGADIDMNGLVPEEQGVYAIAEFWWQTQ